jgi:hypothetical protein
MKKKSLEIKNKFYSGEVEDVEAVILDKKKPAFTINQIIEIDKTLNSKKVGV